MQMRNIAHIGVGNFHRSHQAEYFQQLNERAKAHEQWNIIGISLMSQDEPLLDKLVAQNFQYHLIKRASNGNETITKINVIKDIIFAYKDRQNAINCLADLSTEIISFTITEGAYLFDQKLNQLDWQNEDLLHDLSNLDQPKTIFGLLYNALNKRRQLHGQGVTLMSCDNVRHNGLVLKQALCEFIAKIDNDLMDWVNIEICFPCTMVDRITPSSSLSDQQHLMNKYGIDDSIPVVSETFRQWVIEDNFRFSKPSLDKVGAIFASDVSPFEDLKIKLLNGGHSGLAYLANLMGYEYVHEAIANEALCDFVKSYMRFDAKPSLQLTPGVDVDEYIETLIERFANALIADKVERLCGDGISKLNNFLMPVVKDSISSNRSLKRIAIIYSSYFHYLKKAVENNAGVKYGLYEPQVDAAELKLYSQDIKLLLQHLGVDEGKNKLLGLVQENIEKIDELGAISLLKNEALDYA